MDLKSLVFGNVEFEDGQEFFKFQYRFTCVIIMSGILISGLFLFSAWTGVNFFDIRFELSEVVFFVMCVALLFILRGHPDRLKVVAYIHEVQCLSIFVIAYFFNDMDELRIIWFAINLPGVYLILGSRVGAAVTGFSILFVIFANGWLETPYTIHALVTMVLVLIYISVFFHAFAARSISFHTAMVEANRKLHDLASKDPLTGLCNARAYYALCDRALHQASRTGAPFSVLFVDLDHFKKINDTYGHEAGDAVLCSVADCLTGTVRLSDMVGRIGGEEFSVMLPDTDLAGARALAETLRQHIESLMPDIGTTRLRVTASIGVAVNRPGLLSMADVQREADQAMYVAKRQGRNRVTCVGEVMAMDNREAG